MLARGSSLGALKVDGQAQAGRKVIGAELVGTDADGSKPGFDGSAHACAFDGTFAKSGPLDTRAFAVGVGNQPHGAGDRALDGSIDRLRVYRRALSPDELARQAQQEATIYAPSTGEELVFALDCEDTAQGHAVDRVRGRVASLSGASGISGDAANGSNPACEFGGSTARMTFESVEVSGTELTMMSWVKIDSYAHQSDPRIISKASSTSRNSHDWMLGFGNDGRIHVRIRTRHTHQFHSDQQLDLGEWHHVAATYDGTKVSIYIDGELDRSFDHSGILASRRLPVVVGNQAVGAGDRALPHP